MPTTEGAKVLTPVSRILWGHPCKQRARTDNNNKPIIKADGTPAMSWIFGLGVPKEAMLRQIHAGRQDIEQIVQTQSFERVIWPVMAHVAAQGYPQGAPQNFAWKYDDGDDTRPVNGGGAPYASREGYPGHYCLTVSSALDNPPSVFRFNAQTGGYDQVPADQFKTGDYVVCELNIVCNVPDQRTHTPSLYINPTGVELVGYGKEIVSVAAINPMQAFGGRQHQLPPGASATPMSSAPAGVGMPTGQPPQQQPMPGPGGYAPQPQFQQPAGPAGYAPQPQQQPMPGPGGYAPQQQPMGGYPPPATDFIPGYPVQQPQQQPMPGPAGYGQPQPGFIQPGAQPMGAPAPMTAPGGYAGTPGNPAMGYPSNPQQQPGAPAAYPQPMPGQMPPR